MMSSEGGRRMVALAAVAVAVGAQTLATRDVGADNNLQANDFGVKLLEDELSALVPPTVRRALVLPPTAAEWSSSVDSYFAPLEEPQALDPAAVTPKPTGFRSLISEARGSDITAYRSLDRRLPNRDSAGSLIELTENDVMIPARLFY